MHRKALAEAIGEGEEALKQAMLLNAQEAAVRRLGVEATEVQKEQTRALVAEKMRAEEAFKRIETEQKEGAKDHKRVLEDLKKQQIEVGSVYKVLMNKASLWREEALAGLDETKEGYSQFVAEVEVIFQRMAREAFEKSLESSTYWKDGVIRGLRDVSDAASATERIVQDAFRGMEEALVEFVETGKLNFSSLISSILRDIVRLQIRKDITEPLGNLLSNIFFPIKSILGGGDRVKEDGSSLAGGLFGSKYHAGGVVGEEIPILARKGEAVFTPGQVRLLGEGQSPKVQVHIHNNAPGVGFDVQSTPLENGDIRVDIMADIAEYTEGYIGQRLSQGEGLTPVLKHVLAGNE